MPAPPSPEASEALVRYEELLARALTAADPARAFEEAAVDPALTPELRAVLAHANADGVRLTALLVARLRFERLMHGSLRAVEWYERDAKDFTAEFRRYHHEVPPRALFPQEEAASFEAWMVARGGDQTSAGKPRSAT